MAKPNAQQLVNQQGLKHFSYKCPGLHDSSTIMDIRPCPFGEAFSDRNTRLIIPLIQRHYCWTESQALGWWRAVRGQGHSCLRTFAQKHHCGKIMLTRGYEDKGTLLVIDGQQRFTTTLLLIAALRDAAIQELDRLDATSCYTSPSSETRSDTMRLVLHLDSVLFRDVEAANLFAAKAAVQVASGECNTWGECIGEGIDLPFATLSPCFSDRQPFFEIMLAPICNRALLANHGIAQHPEMHEKTIKSCQYSTKNLFDKQIQTLLSEPTAPSGQEITVSHILRNTMKAALLDMEYMHCEIMSKLRLGQVFLWLQEKSLCGPGSLLFNPNPGLAFHFSDMVRNLLLSRFMESRSMTEQEDIHLNYWLRPLEIPFRDPTTLDTAIRMFLDTHFGALDDPDRYKGSCENDLEAILVAAPSTTAQKMQPALQYARFHSYFEHFCCQFISSKISDGDSDEEDRTPTNSPRSSPVPIILPPVKTQEEKQEEATKTNNNGRKIKMPPPSRSSGSRRRVSIKLNDEQEKREEQKHRKEEEAKAQAFSALCADQPITEEQDALIAEALFELLKNLATFGDELRETGFTIHQSHGYIGDSDPLKGKLNME